MRVVFLEDVPGVAMGGDVKEVKNGFARNFLLPKKLAVPATHNALQRIERLSKEAEDNRLKVLSDMKELGEALEGKQVKVEMRAGASGRLYGSVTNAIVADELSKIMDREVDRRIVEIDEPIRELGTFDINVRLHAEVSAGIKVLVYAMGTDPDARPDADEAEAESPEAVAEEGPVVEAAAVAELKAEVVDEDTDSSEEPEEDAIDNEVEESVAEVAEDMVAEADDATIAEEGLAEEASDGEKE